MLASLTANVQDSLLKSLHSASFNINKRFDMMLLKYLMLKVKEAIIVISSNAANV